MIFLTDACFISHLQELSNSDTIDLRDLLLDCLVGITEPVKEEILHFHLDKYTPISKFLIIPIDQEDFRKVISKYPDIKELDLADQTLWYLGYRQISSKYVILTDDGELFSECYITKIPVMRLPDFVLSLVFQSKITKNQASKCLKFWKKAKRYSKKDLKYWIDFLTEMK
ncbi:MAG: hypothetical protein JW776_10600 [Candidatus Lokiarchaeota archaeon]|nr:hypothetical protein [Candidatus Lokiarchaeota archaeon]